MRHVSAAQVSMVTAHTKRGQYFLVTALPVRHWRDRERSDSVVVEAELGERARQWIRHQLERVVAEVESGQGAEDGQLVGESGVRELVAAEVKGGEGGLEAGIIKLHVNMKNINSKS